MRLSVWVPRAAVTVPVTLLGLLLQTTLLGRNDGHGRYFPQGVTLHLVLLHVQLLPIGEVDVEFVHQHSDILMFLQEPERNIKRLICPKAFTYAFFFSCLAGIKIRSRRWSV